MYKYDEERFNQQEFYNLLKTINLSNLQSRLNDIITYQNWYDKSLSYGTSYFDNPDRKYYKIEDTETNVNHDVLIERFFEIYEWFLDDEDYETLVQKLINVVLGYDVYDPVENFKKMKKVVKDEQVEKIISVEKVVKSKKIKIKDENISEKLDPIFELTKKLAECKIVDNHFDDLLRKINDLRNFKDLTKKEEIAPVELMKNDKIEPLNLELFQNFLDRANKVDKKILYNKLLKNIGIVAIEKTKWPSKKINVNAQTLIEKVCSKCNKSKLLIDYSQLKESADGYFNICMTCRIK